jgi:hypothetical protein
MRGYLCIALVTCLMTGAAKEPYQVGKVIDKNFDSYGVDFIDNNCTNCHDDEKTEADLNLLDLGPVNEENIATWKSIWAQVALGEMPPKKKDKLSKIQKLEFSDWVRQQMERVMKDKGGFHAHKSPKKGNFINHDLLFSAHQEDLQLQPPSSPKRLWRVTPQEHITRLSLLINKEPEYDPSKPGLRTFGDAVPSNHGGELKLYFGVDRINGWQGGTVAYATAVKSVPVVLSTMRKHGFASYADMHGVNSAESTQILSKAKDILKYMAYGPESLVTMKEQITDDPKTYEEVRPPGDLRGLPSAITYSTKIKRPLTPVHDLFKDPAKQASESDIRKAISYLFEMLTFRPPTQKEVNKYYQVVKSTMVKLGQKDGLMMGLSAVFLDRDALFRTELAESSQPDQNGRVILQDWELGLALNHAFSYVKPDEELRSAIIKGKMKTRDDVKRELSRILADESIRKPRVLQFFREYFDYDVGGYICKDDKALKDAGVTGKKAGQYYQSMFYASASTDRLVELIIAEDKHVLKQLLTTQKVVAHPTDSLFFGQYLTLQEKPKADPKLIAEGKIKIKEIQEEVKLLNKQVKSLSDEKKKNTLKQRIKKLMKQSKGIMEQHEAFSNPEVKLANFEGPNISARLGRRSFGKGFRDINRKLSTAPKGQRLGILTHPSWLVSHSDAMDNHAIHRGIWIRERLLGGGIPDVPITVDAQLPDEPESTLRDRMRVTQEKYCWGCHDKMDPLGLTFESYNHVGIYRQLEKGKPVNTSGEIIDSGDSDLDGPVANAFEMIHKLANSERVEQVFIRHAFRFWMGRNETLHDGPVLQEAHKAYKESGGSMNALLISLLSSDAFLYRR